MAACENKKMSFSIENLAKSSRTEEQTDEDYGFYFMNTNAWQNGQLFNMAARCFSNNPLYNATAQTPSGDNVFYSRGIIRESSRLSSVSPDSGYSSQNSTPSASGSYSKKRMRRVPAVVLSPSEAGSGSQKRKRPDTDDECSDGKVTPEIVANNRLESVCQASDTDEGIGETPRPKKARTAFSNDQIEVLEVRYRSQKYLPAGERARLAASLVLSDQQIKTWFQNRRMKEKRRQKDDRFPGGVPLPTGGVDIAQLQALGIPCPPPYTINSKHQQMMRDEGYPSSPLSSPGTQSPMFHGTPHHVPFYARFQPITNVNDSLSGFPSPSNQVPGYR